MYEINSGLNQLTLISLLLYNNTFWWMMYKSFDILASNNYNINKATSPKD
jgi:hypothetical protein